MEFGQPPRAAFGGGNFFASSALHEYVFDGNPRNLLFEPGSQGGQVQQRPGNCEFRSFFEARSLECLHQTKDIRAIGRIQLRNQAVPSALRSHSNFKRVAASRMRPQQFHANLEWQAPAQLRNSKLLQLSLKFRPIKNGRRGPVLQDAAASLNGTEYHTHFLPWSR